MDWLKKLDPSLRQQISPHLVDFKTACKLTKRSSTYIRNLVKQGYLPSIKQGRQLFLPLSAVLILAWGENVRESARLKTLNLLRKYASTQPEQWDSLYPKLLDYIVGRSSISDVARLFPNGQ